MTNMKENEPSLLERRGATASYFAKTSFLFHFYEMFISPQYQATMYSSNRGEDIIALSLYLCSRWKVDQSQWQCTTWVILLAKKKSIMVAIRSRGKEEIDQPMFISCILS